MRYDFWRRGSMKLPDISYSSIAYSLLVTAFSPTQKTPPKIKKQRPSIKGLGSSAKRIFMPTVSFWKHYKVDKVPAEMKSHSQSIHYIEIA